MSLTNERGPTSEELLKYLEKVSGRRLRTRVDIQRYLEEISAPKPVADIKRRNQRIAEQAVLLMFLAFAVLQYYYLDAFTQIYSLRGVTVFVPVPEQKPKTARELDQRHRPPDFRLARNRFWVTLAAWNEFTADQA